MARPPRSSARLLVGFALSAGLVCTAALSACGGPETPTGTTARRPPAAPPAVNNNNHAAANSAAPAQSAGSGADASTPAPTNSAAARATLEAKAKAASECSAPTSAILNIPDGGTVFNNAMTSVDAGFIDRTQGVLDAIIGRSTAIRCCFDASADKAEEARAFIVLNLSPEGPASSVRIDRKQSTVLPELVSECLNQVLLGASYPASPTGNSTIVEYLLRVQRPAASTL